MHHKRIGSRNLWISFATLLTYIWIHMITKHAVVKLKLYLEVTLVHYHSNIGRYNNTYQITLFLCFVSGRVLCHFTIEFLKQYRFRFLFRSVWISVTKWRTRWVWDCRRTDKPWCAGRRSSRWISPEVTTSWTRGVPVCGRATPAPGSRSPAARAAASSESSQNLGSDQVHNKVVVP